MFIYLDESYNLSDRSKKQFISINGFAVLDEKSLFKRWKEYRSPFTGRRRIHAQDSSFNALRVKALKLFARPDLTLLTAFQVVQEIPFDAQEGYFRGGRMDFEKVCADLLKALLRRLQPGEYQSVKIIVDSRKHKGGVLARCAFRKDIDEFLAQSYPQTRADFTFQPSTTDILIEFADFISNIFYRAYLKDDEQFFKNLQFKLIQLKNPL